MPRVTPAAVRAKSARRGWRELGEQGLLVLCCLFLSLWVDAVKRYKLLGKEGECLRLYSRECTGGTAVHVVPGVIHDTGVGLQERG